MSSLHLPYHFAHTSILHMHGSFVTDFLPLQMDYEQLKDKIYLIHTQISSS